MNFLYPLGLLGLIGIPVLIFIYILKNKYTEQTVSSTYLWTLSEKFLKRKKKLPKIAGLVSLLLQLFAVFAISLTIANPVFTLKGKANEIIYIFDASASMNMEYVDGESRFNVGKEMLFDNISDTADGSVFSLIVVDGVTTQLLLDQTTDKNALVSAVENIKPSYVKSDLTDALKLSQSYFDLNAGAKVYVVTDKIVEKHDNVSVLSVASGKENFSLAGVNYTFIDGILSVEAMVTSYVSSSEVTVELVIDDETNVKKSATVETVKDTPKRVQIDVEVDQFSYFTVRIKNSDALKLDNSCVVYNVVEENEHRTLVVSDTPFFFKTAIESMNSVSVDVISSKEYYLDSSDVHGYGLYVFDSVYPTSLPNDGSVWLINQNENIVGSKFSVQTEVILQDAVKLELEDDSSTLVQDITNDLIGIDLYVYKYVKYGVGGGFTTIYSYNGQPIIFVGENVFGNRQVVFSFSLHDSNFPLSPDFVTLVRNLYDYSFPNVMDKVVYSCGEKLSINVPPASSAIVIESPSGEKTFPSSNVIANEYVFEEVGLYTVTVTIGGADTVYHMYAGVPKEESEVFVTLDDYSLLGFATDGKMDGYYDDLIFVFIFLSLVFIFDWVVYCYDKYQLR